MRRNEVEDKRKINTKADRGKEGEDEEKEDEQRQEESTGGGKEWKDVSGETVIDESETE